MTAAVVLAAGASTRLGEPKQLALLGNETLLDRAVRIARGAGCAPIVVVLGAGHTEVLARCQLAEAVTIINQLWHEGMASSICLAVQTLEMIAVNATGVIVMTCDQPAVTAEHLRTIVSPEHITASSYAGHSGVPAYFPRRYFANLATLSGDAGARTLLGNAYSKDLPFGDLDVDTLDDLARAREIFG